MTQRYRHITNRQEQTVVNDSDRQQELLMEHRSLAEAAHGRDDIPEANYQYGWVAALTAVLCPHDSLSGDEGPVAELGRMPVRWRCDECGTVIHQCACRCGALNGCRCLLSDNHTGDHQCAHGYWHSADELLTQTAQAICDAEYRGDQDISPFPRTVKERHRRMARAAIAVVDGEVEKLRGVIIDGAVDAYKRERNLT